jgi:hypothetical protein
MAEQDYIVDWKDPSSGLNYETLMVLTNHGGIENNFQENEGYGRIIFEENYTKKIVQFNLTFKKYVEKLTKITEIDAKNFYFLDTNEEFKGFEYITVIDKRNELSPMESEFKMESKKGIIAYEMVTTITPEMRELLNKMGETSYYETIEDKFFKKGEELFKYFAK